MVNETTESIRRDSAVRQIEQKEVQDWSGKRVVLPRGTTLPATGLEGEMFVKVYDSDTNHLCMWDKYLDHWVTVGPSV